MRRKPFFIRPSGWRGAALAAPLIIAACSGGGGNGLPTEDAAGGENSAPIASNVDMQTVPSSSLIIRVLDSSTDLDGDQLKLVYVTQPSHGAVTIEDNGTPADPFDDYLRYVCDDIFVGVVSFQYTISDGGNGRATGNVSITVGTGANNPPVAVNDMVTVAVNGSIAVDVLGNDTDPDGDSISINSFTAPAAGAVVLNDGGTADPADDRLVYTPLPAFTGVDSFTYRISDGDLASDGLVTIVVGAAGPTEQVCGNVMKGAVSGALVQLFPIDGTGAATTTIPVAQALTDSAGNWCADVPLPRGALLVRSLGGQFIDETDTSSSGSARRTIVLDASSYLETALLPSDDFAAINVYTNAIYEKARRVTGSGGFAGVFAVERNLYQQAFGWPTDLLQLDPANPAALEPTALQAARVYAMALGGIANVVNEVAVDFAESQMTFGMIRAVVIDLTDCLLDGHFYSGAVRTPAEFDLNGSPVFMPTDLQLNLSILRFRNNNLSDFGSTPLAQIDAGVCLGADDSDDALPPTFVPDPLSALSFPATGPLTDLLAVTPVPLITDNLDPAPTVVAVAINTDSGAPIPPGSPDVPPGAYDITWEASDSTGNTVQRVQRITILANSNGTITLSPDDITPGETLTVSVADADLDSDAAVADMVDVTVSNTVTLEVETVTLTETGANSGIFQGTLATQFGSGGTNDNGVLDVQAGEAAQARYDDALDATGNPAVRTDLTSISGGDNGSIVVSPGSIV
ncbi:MAG: cadherin-like domain-containing protein, partial [Gammaproteobacteria bacterium]|nr:cadherin-like domain-containing protein [Gammaproteobacteria bacterium]